MKTDTKSRHIAPSSGNVFADPGFSPKETTALKAESKRIVSEKVVIKNSRKSELVVQLKVQ